MAAAGRPQEYKSCQHAAAHRKAQNKYVAKDPKGQAARVKKSENKHPAKHQAVKQKTAAKAKRSSGGSKSPGRPRKC